MKLDAYLIPYTNINSKLIHDLNVRPKIMKLWEENTEQKCHDIWFGIDFWDMTPKGTGNNNKTRQIGLPEN